MTRNNKEKSFAKKAFGTMLKYGFIVVLTLLISTNLAGIKNFANNLTIPNEWRKATTVSVMNYNLDEEVLGAMETAHAAAYDYASNELDSWIGTLNNRSDAFIDEYFKYMQVKGRELKALASILPFYKYNSLDELDREINKKVIKPDLSQQCIENITNGTIDRYLSMLDIELGKIQEEHNIPVPEWNKYISRLCGLTNDVTAKQFPIAVKGVVIGGVGLTAVTIPLGFNVAKKVSQKIALKKGISVAAKSGAKTLSNGAKALPGIGWAIAAITCGWDFYDYHKTAKAGRAELKGNFREFFQEMKTELLGNTDDSIMGAVTQWENSIRARMAAGAHN